MTNVWAGIPVKEFAGAKQRLSGVLSPGERRLLAATMLEDVLAALAGASRLTGIMINTSDPDAIEIAHRYGARVVQADAWAGHTAAVNGMAKIFRSMGRAGFLTIPGDIPGVTASEIDTLIGSSLQEPSFTIVPAHDELGSNAVLCMPSQSIPMRFGDDSFFSHLMIARQHGVLPTVVRLRGISMDIDHRADLRMFMQSPTSTNTRTRALLDRFGM